MGLKAERNRQDALDWLMDDRQDWPYSFRNVCDTLGFDTSAMRKGILAVMGTKRPGRRRVMAAVEINGGAN